MGIKLRTDDGGQSSLDFIFGFGVFLLIFIFAISFISGLFMPFQPGAIDLSSVAYRTTTLLVEDPGWFIGASGTPSGTALWEDYNLSRLEETGSGLRIGLANNKSTPNMLSIDKINAFQVLANDNYAIARDKMGLNGSVEYNFNITLIANMTLPNNRTNVKNTVLLNVTSPYLHDNNVELLDRKVMVSMGKELFLDCGIPVPGSNNDNNEQKINMSNLTADNYNNVSIRIFNASRSVSNPTAHISEVNWNEGGLKSWIYGDDYKVYLNGNYVTNFDPAGVTMNGTDILEIVIYNKAFRDSMTGNIDSNKKTVYIKSDDGIFPGGDVKYFDDDNFHLKDVYYPATLRLEIWSYDFR